RLFTPAPLPARDPAKPEPAPVPTPANPARPLLPVLMPLDRLRAIRDGLNARLEAAEADAVQRQREAEALETILKGLEQAKPPEKGG
ncbi:MAG: hypothetical protein MUF18_07215, partial [Fimbriiglobus sp.]|nr:hypothetical protein [Fimbriiglobus sp.]